MRTKYINILSRYKNDRLLRLGFFTVGISDTFGYALFKKLPDDKFDWRERDRFREFKKMSLPNLKFISFEPLLKDALGDEDLRGISWVIIGARTSPNIQPKPEWVDKIFLEARSSRNIPIFLKNNLEYQIKCQEIPEGR